MKKNLEIFENLTVSPIWITQRVIRKFLAKKDSFTIRELNKEIIDNGGILRVGPNYTVFDYLEFLMIMGNLDKEGNDYVVVRNE